MPGAQWWGASVLLLSGLKRVGPGSPETIPSEEHCQGWGGFHIISSWYSFERLQFEGTPECKEAGLNTAH